MTRNYIIIGEYFDCTLDDCSIIIDDDNNYWFLAKKLTEKLKYKKTDRAIKNNIDQSNKVPLKTLFRYITFKPPNSQPNTIYTNYEGIVELIIKSKQVSATKIAKKLGIDIYRKINFKEYDIIEELHNFLEKINITGVQQYSVKNKNTVYKIDYYLPEHKLAIEIDEFNHKDRDEEYEKTREAYIKKKLGCQFIRCDPDDPNFSIGTLIGRICRRIYK